MCGLLQLPFSNCAGRHSIFTFGKKWSILVEFLYGFAKSDIRADELKLGDIPYIYSVVPLSQTSNTPIFELDYSTGVRGNQSSSVETYKKYLDTVAENFIRNVGGIKGE